ncbi:MAG: hypothetical protein V3T77_00080 [Planctomycetota bacterium]
MKRPGVSSSSILRWLTLLLILAPASSAVSQCPEESTVGDFTCQFQGVTYNPDFTSSWSYTLVWDGTLPALEHLTIGLCPQAQVVSSTPPADTFGYDGTSGIFGIKWDFDEDFPAEIPVEFSFVLGAHYAADEVQFAAKVSQSPYLSVICGPNTSCLLTSLPPLKNLQCSQVEACSCDVLLTWESQGSYEEIQVFVNGQAIAELPGDATEHNFTLPSLDTFEVCVIGLVGEQNSEPVCCAIGCPEIPALPPTSFECQGNPDECTYKFGWQNSSEYAFLQLFVDGVLVQTLPGDAQSTAIEESLTPGIHEVSLGAETICGEPVPAVSCLTDCTIDPPETLFAVACQQEDPCAACEALLTWINLEKDYDSIDIFLDGILSTTLPGDATQHMQLLGPPGNHVVCMVPMRDGITSVHSCCTVECLNFAPLPPTQVTCEGGSPPNCLATLSWVNPIPYGIVEILLDGNPVEFLPGDAQEASILLPDSGDYVLSLRGTTICGEPTAIVECAVNCPGALGPLMDFECTLMDPCGCVAEISWSNGEAYDSIQLIIDGLLHEFLPGDFESLTVTLPGPGAHEICMIPEIGSLPADASCCVIECATSLPLPPINVACLPEPSDCSVAVSWENPSLYQSLQVSVDGALVAILPGDAESFTVGPDLDGPHEISISGVTVCGETFPTVSCSIACEVAPAEPVSELSGNFLDLCSCIMQLSWINQDEYDAIDIFLDGSFIASLFGGADSFIVELPSPEEHVLCVVPTRDGISADQECWTTNCPVTTPHSPTILICEVDEPECVATVSWLNQSIYNQLRVTVDGVLVQILAGDAETAMVPITLGNSLIGLEGTTVCGKEFNPVSCQISCDLVQLSDTQLIAGRMNQGAIGDVLVNPGDAAEVRFFYIAPNSNIQGYSLALCFDCTLFGVEGSFTVEDTIVEITGAEFIGQNVDNDPMDGDGCEFVVGVLLDAIAPFEGQTLPPTVQPLDIGSLQFLVPVDAECPNCYPVEFCDGINGAGEAPLSNRFVINTQSVSPGETFSTNVCVPVNSTFIRGDSNNDALLNISDLIFTLNYLFLSGPEPDCEDAADSNDDGNVNISDPIFLGLYLFQEGLPPPPPFPTCGADNPAVDELTCVGPVMGCPLCR